MFDGVEAGVDVGHFAFEPIETLINLLESFLYMGESFVYYYSQIFYGFFNRSGEFFAEVFS